MNLLSQFPLPFWLVLVALAISLKRAWSARRESWGFPTMAVLITVAAWYVGDVFVNDYLDYQLLFGNYLLGIAWWEVLLFIVAFGLLVRPVHRWLNAKLLNRRSSVVQYLTTRRLEAPDIQAKLDLLCYGLLLAWIILYLVAIVRVNGDLIGLFAPYLGEKAEPWSRTRIGSGFDSLISLASNFQILIAAGFGVLAAIAQRGSTRLIAILICMLTLPYFIFDRTRNIMLASILPGLLSWIFFRLRGGMVLKGTLLVAAFFIIHLWFSFVMNTRGERSIASAVASKDDTELRDTDQRTKSGEGLNMFEELSWINAFMLTGMYNPNWGERYFAELVNPIPRALWPGKPLIGIDYAILRGQSGQSGADADAAEGGVFASISTGMIGQGVVNFGGFLGPVAAAFLMALWVATLARQDLLGQDPGRFLLYGSGMVLTFNMGRDITLLVLYPFVFGLALLWLFNKFSRKRTTAALPGSSAGRARGIELPRGKFRSLNSTLQRRGRPARVKP